jgi:hypothetical protein
MSTRYIKKVFGNNIASEQNENELENETNDVNFGRENQNLFNVFDVVSSLFIIIK